MVRGPEVSIHVLGEYHGFEGIAFLPEFQRQVRNFFFPRRVKGEPYGNNILIAEGYKTSDRYRAELVEFSKEYSPLEANIRASLWKVNSKLTSDELNREISKRIKERRESPKFRSDYYTQQWIILDRLRESIDFRLDVEHHSPEEIISIETIRKRMIEEGSKAQAALWYGETDLAIEKYSKQILDESQLTRNRHQVIINLVWDYIKTAQSSGIPLRLLVHFGNGHVQGLTRSFEKAFGDLGANINISGSYASGVFNSYHYDLVSRMETDPEMKPIRREALNTLIQNAFEYSPFCSNHLLRRTISCAELSSIIYPLIGSYSDNQINELIETMLNVNFEQGLVQLTGIGDNHQPPSALVKILRWPIIRVSKLLFLGK